MARRATSSMILGSPATPSFRHTRTSHDRFRPRSGAREVASSGADGRAEAGRWLVWTGRAVLWALLWLLSSMGSVHLLRGLPRVRGAPARRPFPLTDFPSDPAASLSRAQFAAVYLNFAAADAPSRAGETRRVPGGRHGSPVGLGRHRQMAAGAIQPYGIEVTEREHAIVTLAYQSGSRRMLLSVPSTTRTRRRRSSWSPAGLPYCPRRPGGPAPARQPDSDEAAAPSSKPRWRTSSRPTARATRLDCSVMPPREDHGGFRRRVHLRGAQGHRGAGWRRHPRDTAAVVCGACRRRGAVDRSDRRPRQRGRRRWSRPIGSLWRSRATNGTSTTSAVPVGPCAVRRTNAPDR